MKSFLLLLCVMFILLGCERREYSVSKFQKRDVVFRRVDPNNCGLVVHTEWVPVADGWIKRPGRYAITVHFADGYSVCEEADLSIKRQ